MDFPAFQAAIFLPFAIAIGLWVSWSDMKFMRIPNQAVVALALVFVVLGPFLFPLHSYLWQLAHLPVVLVIGFLLNMTGAVGAGDAKFAAAMAPFFALHDLPIIVGMGSATLLAAFATHRLLGLVPALRSATAEWESWRRRDFPMGLALSGVLIFYLLLAVALGHLH
ncbi:MAG: hypothetical protein GC186_10840 [Rhodobacteraceae bacterium]|nr:hypothetical protein [Paracoccaceae bacterium]